MIAVLRTILINIHTTGNTISQITTFHLKETFACVIGILFALLLNGKESGKAFPFGPALSLAAMLVILWGEPIVNAYLGLFS